VSPGLTEQANGTAFLTLL